MQHDDCHVEPLEKPLLDRAALETAMAAYLTVGGMGCPRCALRVHNGLLRLDGVLLAGVSLEQGIAAAAYDAERITPNDPSTSSGQRLVQAVAGAGNDGRHHYWAHVVAVMLATEALTS